MPPSRRRDEVRRESVAQRRRHARLVGSAPAFQTPGLSPTLRHEITSSRRQFPGACYTRAKPLQPRCHVRSGVRIRFVFEIWSGARDLNPGPHGPEIYAVSSMEIVFDGLSSFRALGGRFPASFSHQARPDYYMNYYTERLLQRTTKPPRNLSVPRRTAPLSPTRLTTCPPQQSRCSL